MISKEDYHCAERNQKGVGTSVACSSQDCTKMGVMQVKLPTSRMFVAVQKRRRQGDWVE